RKFTRIQIFGKDIERLKARKNPGLDIFVVKEAENRNCTVYSYGGVTKKNKGAYYDYLSAPRFVIKKEVGACVSVHVKRYYIYKEEISLKELDFKLRKQLIEKNNLYGNVGSGKIVIKMKNGGKYTFELHKKLQENRMADVIDGTNIDNIEVNIK
ncbi:exotoxin beta-grasp domain-containing protein, partial [Staphylococcus aureus]